MPLQPSLGTGTSVATLPFPPGPGGGERRSIGPGEGSRDPGGEGPLLLPLPEQFSLALAFPAAPTRFSRHPEAVDVLRPGVQDKGALVACR